MTIIYSNFLDDDCRILQRIWNGFDNVNVIEITPSSENYEDDIDEAISNEEDTLIICGHGTGNGLLFPNIYRGEYLIHENNIPLIKAKKVICCWCYAATFVMNNNMENTFATSMFISNEMEAADNGILCCTQEEINKNSERFFNEVNYLIRNNI